MHPLSFELITATFSFTPEVQEDKMTAAPTVSACYMNLFTFLKESGTGIQESSSNDHNRGGAITSFNVLCF